MTCLSIRVLLSLSLSSPAPSPSTLPLPLPSLRFPPSTSLSCPPCPFCIFLLLPPSSPSRAVGPTPEGRRRGRRPSPECVEGAMARAQERARRATSCSGAGIARLRGDSIHLVYYRRSKLVVHQRSPWDVSSASAAFTGHGNRCAAALGPRSCPRASVGPPERGAPGAGSARILAHGAKQRRVPPEPATVPPRSAPAHTPRESRARRGHAPLGPAQSLSAWRR